MSSISLKYYDKLIDKVVHKLNKVCSKALNTTVVNNLKSSLIGRIVLHE